MSLHAAACLAILNHIVFIGGGKLFFRSPNGLLSLRRFGPFAVVYLASAITSSYLQLMHPSRFDVKRSLALALAGLSSAVFASTVAATRDRPLTPINTRDQPEHLNKHGPYALVRHPFYSAYILNFLGAAIGAGAKMSWFCFLVIAGVYYQAAREEEGKFESSGLSAAYREYKAKTSMLVPWLL